MKEEANKETFTKEVSSSGKTISLDVPFPRFFSNPIGIFISLMLFIFFSESIVMLIIAFLNSFDLFQEMLINVSLLTLILFPLLFFLLLRPMQSLVNERKKIEDALRASNDRLEETVNKCKIVEEKLREYNVELGELVKERTAELLKANEKLKLEIEIKSKTENELRSKINELEKFYEMSVGRELKMKELTEENEKLKSELLKYKM